MPAEFALARHDPAAVANLGRGGPGPGSPWERPEHTPTREIQPGLRGFGQVDRPMQKVGSDGSACGVRVHQGWVMLDAGIEQIASAGLDHPREAAPVECRPHLRDLPTESLGLVVGVESPGVQGDRDAFVSFVGQELDRIDQTVVGQAVGVVAEFHAQSGSTPRSRSLAASVGTLAHRPRRWRSLGIARLEFASSAAFR